jgi:hypothetical protein
MLQLISAESLVLINKQGQENQYVPFSTSASYYKFSLISINIKENTGKPG